VYVNIGCGNFNSTTNLIKQNDDDEWSFSSDVDSEEDYEKYPLAENNNSVVTHKYVNTHMFLSS
jgi:hypothetical protein